MMRLLGVVLFVALAGLQLGHGLPLGSTPQTYPHDTSGPSVFEAWGGEGGLYTAIPALALVLTAVGLLFGCTWCYRHKDCKPEEGADNQLFSTSATHLHDARRSLPPEPFVEPVNNNISEDNNNGPISLREMQNIANNNATAYIVCENEERNRVSRESVVEFEPLPAAIGVVDPLERYADWFGGEDFSRNRLQYLREFARGWFGRVVETEMEGVEATTTVAVKILNQNASLEDKARFLNEARIYRDVRHENILALVGKCLQEDPWILIFEMCSMDLRQYLIVHRPKMEILNEGGVPLRLMCDVTAALTYLHSQNYILATGPLCCDNVLVRGSAESARAVLGNYVTADVQYEFAAPETRRHPPVHTASSEVWSLGTLIWEVCTWGASVPPQSPSLPADVPCPYRNHLYQVMQLCWNPNPEARPTAAQVYALINHLHTTHARADTPQDDGYGSSDFEDRWQRLKPNSIPKVDEHVAIVHAPSTSMASHFSSEQDLGTIQTIHDTLSVDMDTAVSRSSSIMSDKDPLSVQIKSESLTNLHGSLEDVRNIYLTHNEMALLECHQGNIALDDRERDNSDSSMDPWLKDIIAGSQDDVSYYKDVSDVIKNLDNILNSEKTSSSESSHQASPSRDNLSLDCKKDYQMQSSMVKSPAISNFQNVLEMGFGASNDDEPYEDDEADRDTIGTLSHSYERHSDTASQHTLENLTPETPIDVVFLVESHIPVQKDLETVISGNSKQYSQIVLPKENNVESSDSIPMLKELCLASMPSVSETNEQLNVREDCETPCDNNLKEIVRTDMEEVKTKSIDNTTNEILDNDTMQQQFTCKTNVMKSELTENDDDDDETDDIEANIHSKKYPHSVEEAICEEKPMLVNNIAANEVERDPATTSNRTPSTVKKYETVVTKPELHLENEISHPNVIEITSNEQIMISRKENVINATNVQTCEEKNDKLVSSSLIQSENQTIANELAEMITDISNDAKNKVHEDAEIPESVQSMTQKHTQTPIESTQDVNTEITKNASSIEVHDLVSPTSILPPEQVQNIVKVDYFITETEDKKDVTVKEDSNNTLGSESDKILSEQQSNNSTTYMDLINDTNSKIKQVDMVDNNVKKVIKSCLDKSNNDSTCPVAQDDPIVLSMLQNESTVYLDLPSLLNGTSCFLQSERVNSSENLLEGNTPCASTPKGSIASADNTLENCKTCNQNVMSKTKLPDYGSGDTLTKLEQESVPESMSPLESPSKSHHTDTYDENSSVVLGPFENCTAELLKNVMFTDLIDLPKEELLAFSSNFSDINLETPSPLRDGNFLNEVPDIFNDDSQFDEIIISELTSEKNYPQTDNSEETDQSGTAKRVSPLTPPNSPGVFLASTSQQKYLVDIDLDPPESIQSYPPIDCDSGLSSLQKEIDLNQIEMTTKLAMAENENNMNIEYSGPLTVEGLVSEDEVILMESDAIPELYLAGNGGSVEDLREGLALDEDCMKALRNELELKLPLAQVAAIEPACEQEWSELPPPPELVVNYNGAGALSPIAEETRHQLSAYDNDAWNTSTRTDSSESYPEPCNNSTDEVTDMPTGAPSGSADHSTYTIQSRAHSTNATYTIQKDIPSSKEMTMSADSLNGSPLKKPKDVQSPIDDKTYNKNEEEPCERLSQVSPYILSPTTDTSVPVDSENLDNATGVSTLSKPTVPTDAKLSKPSECLSKATSIDSWCSNDTLYNVDENFDELAMDPEIPLDFETDIEEKEDKSDSSATLTHNDDEREQSHCSTYIIHDSKSDASETFSPDSITANDKFTFTKVKIEATETAEGKSEVNNSTKNTQTKDLAYGTLPTYSNCTTEILLDNPWKLQQPELVRKFPTVDVEITPPRMPEDKEHVHIDSPQTTKPRINAMDSVDLFCLQDDILSSENKTTSSENQGLVINVDDSPKYNNYNRNMAPSVTSTPLAEPVGDDNYIRARMAETDSPEFLMNNIPNFTMIVQSLEIRPQDVSSNASSDHASTNPDTNLLEGESKTLSKNSIRDSDLVLERTPTYSDFENSGRSKPQDMPFSDPSIRSLESETSSGEFRQFKSSVMNCPQDLSSVIDASSLLLISERKSSEFTCSLTNTDLNRTIQLSNRVIDHESQSVGTSVPNVTNLYESHEVANNINKSRSDFVTVLVSDEETEQPHSIIITEIMKDFSSPNISNDSHTTASRVIITAPEEVLEEIPNITYDSHAENRLNCTYDSHINSDPFEPSTIYGIGDEHVQITEIKTLKCGSTATREENLTLQNHTKDVLNGSLLDSLPTIDIEIKCNGNSENFATVNFLNETFEELIVSNVDENESKDAKNVADVLLPNAQVAPSNNDLEEVLESHEQNKSPTTAEEVVPQNDTHYVGNKMNGQVEEEKVASVTDNFLQNEKKFCQFDSYLPLLSDIRFTGPAAEIISTSFSRVSPTEDTPECERDNKPDTISEIIKDWDSDSESHSSNSSSGEFIWKDGDGRETAVVPTTHFDHQRGSGSGASGADSGPRPPDGGASDASGASGDSGSGSEGDEVEFVPSSWDCRAEPSKSSLRSLEQTPPDSKKHVVFKRQKYHCVYEYPREVVDVDSHSPAYLPDLSTYCEWDPTSAEEAELGYGQLFGGSPLDLYPLRAGIAFGADFDEDFFISSSARPFESLGLMSTTSQFFPGMHVKPSTLLERDLSDEITDEFPSPPSPLAPTTLVQTRMPSLDFTTPDSGVEDITPGSTSTDEDFKTKKVPESEVDPGWRGVDSGSSSESVSPSSPGGEVLGGLRHTRDKLKLDLPPSPHIPSPRHNRVFNFVLDKPKRHRTPDERTVETGTTPLVMTDETPIITTSLPLPKESEETTAPEPTFSTFGKNVQKNSDSEQKIILTDEVQEETIEEIKAESLKAVEPAKGESTVVDSGDEDSGIESSSKATLERNKTPNVS